MQLLGEHDLDSKSRTESPTRSLFQVRRRHDSSFTLFNFEHFTKQKRFQTIFRVIVSLIVSFSCGRALSESITNNSKFFMWPYLIRVNIIMTRKESNAGLLLT